MSDAEDEAPTKYEVDAQTAAMKAMLEGWALVKQGPGFKRWMRVEPDGTVRIRNDVDVEPTFEANHDFRMAEQGKRWGDGKIVASIPLHMLFRDRLGEIVKNDDEKALRSWLNSSDHYKFRTKEGKL